MCMMCDGFDVDDTLALTAAQLAEYGWIVTGVGDPPDDVHEHDAMDGLHWAYTVGLLDRFGHPELVVAGPDTLLSSRLIHRLVRRIEWGWPLTVGRSPFVDDGIVRIGAVHPVQNSLGTFNMWHALQQHGHIQAPALLVMQAYAPRSWFCECHRHAQPNLSDPGVTLVA